MNADQLIFLIIRVSRLAKDRKIVLRSKRNITRQVSF